MKRLALKLIDLLLAYVASGDHTFGYNDAVRDAREAVGYIKIYYPPRRLSVRAIPS